LVTGRRTPPELGNSESLDSDSSRWPLSLSNGIDSPAQTETCFNGFDRLQHGRLFRVQVMAKMAKMAKMALISLRRHVVEVARQFEVDGARQTAHQVVAGVAPVFGQALEHSRRAGQRQQLQRYQRRQLQKEQNKTNKQTMTCKGNQEKTRYHRISSFYERKRLLKTTNYKTSLQN